MEYIYSAMLLHSAGKEITGDAVTGILKAAGIEADPARVKALIASLKEVNIDEAIEKASVVQAPAPSAQAEGAKKEEKAAEEKEEEGKTEEEAAQGLSSLFG